MPLRAERDKDGAPRRASPTDCTLALRAKRVKDGAPKARLAL